VDIEEISEQLERLTVAARSYAAMSGDPDWDALDEAARVHYLGEVRQVVTVLDAYDAQRLYEKRAETMSRNGTSVGRKRVEVRGDAGKMARKMLKEGATFAATAEATGVGYSAMTRMAHELRKEGYVLCRRPVARNRKPSGVQVPDPGAGREVAEGLVERNGGTFR
jgi:hypothetical protein